MSVLLRQAEIFERILPLLVHRDPLDCSVADCPHKGATNNHLDPATPLQVLGPGHYYEITGFDESQDVAPPMDSPAFGKHASRFEHDVWIPKLLYEGPKIVNVAGAVCHVEHRIASTSGFNVLLRHRPRSIPQAQESA